MAPAGGAGDGGAGGGAGLGRAALLAGLAGGVALAVALRRRAQIAGGPRRAMAVPDVEPGTLEGVAAELRLRGVDARVERTLDLTVDPGVERPALTFPVRDERRVQRHLPNLLAPRQRHPT